MLSIIHPGIAEMKEVTAFHAVVTPVTIASSAAKKNNPTGSSTLVINHSGKFAKNAQISSQYAIMSATMPTTAATIAAAHPTEIPRRDATPVTTQVIACHTRPKALATSFTAAQIFAATPAIRPNAFTAAHTTGITIASTAAILPIVSPRSFHACSVSFTPNNFFRNSPTDCAILPTSPSVLSS